MIVNLRALELVPTDEPAPEGHTFTLWSLSQQFGSTLTGLGVYEVEPGQSTWPYHFELAEEEWVIVISGELTLRTPDGERRLRAGDVACFPAGPSGAHAVRNDGSEPARFAMPSSMARFADGAVYPDSGTFVVRSPGFTHRGRLGDEVPYWEGEA